MKMYKVFNVIFPLLLHKVSMFLLPSTQLEDFNVYSSLLANTI